MSDPIADISPMPSPQRIMAVLAATWPALETVTAAPWDLRRDLGGGNRVTAAALIGPEQDGIATIAEAEAVMTGWGQPRLFQVTPDEPALDAALEGRGYTVHEPVILYAGRAADLTGTEGHVAAAYRAAFAPAVLQEIWRAGGIGPARLAIMDRPTGPKTLLMSRSGDRPAGGAFVALDGGVAMIHAIEVLERYRRQGCAKLLIEVAARFAVEQGADWLTLAVTVANQPARALYAALGMVEAGAYHYRIAA